MENNERPSYAQRSKKYNDSSNFGYTADTPPVQESEPPYEPTYEDATPTESENAAGYEDGRVLKTRSELRTGKSKRKQKEKSSTAIGWIISIAAAVCVAIVIRLFVFEIILVDGQSMEPTLITNERVAVEKVSRYFGLPKRGDIIIVNYPDVEGTFVKRAIGLPGEMIEVKNSTVFVDGVPLEEDYINSAEPYADMAPVTVPENHVFVMGDNRAHSLDSRTYYIGPIHESAIIGHGVFIIWPFNQMRGIS